MKRLVISNEGGQYLATVEKTDVSEPGEGETAIDIEYSTLNYKDALAITGKGKIIRDFPMTPGIDLVGKVRQSDSTDFAPGQRVLLNGFGYGERFPGGLSQHAVVKSKHLITLPKSLNAVQSMIIGTAGYTAMLCVMALQQAGVTPDKGEVLVTGANGGVGSTSIMLLSALGYTVVGSTGRLEEEAFLRSLGARSIVHRDTLNTPAKPLGKERWAGVIDSLGSHTLANACATTQYGGAVAACGLAQGMDFVSSVAPFILRGVKLLGIDSVNRPLADRAAAWDHLAMLIDAEKLESLSTVISLEECAQTAEKLLAGEIRGRVVVDVNAR